MSERFDIIVVGGGHAGTEAAWAAASRGASVALVTMSREALGRMSCNPAIGGLGKGQMVREIDALGGLMGRAIDRAGIQFRMLNQRKGPAVWAPRAQADRDAYPAILLELIETNRNLTIIEGLVDRIIDEEVSPATDHGPQRRVTGVTLEDGRQLAASNLILTTGTFLRGLMHCGNEQTRGGRHGEPSSEGISGVLRELGLELGRLKTGTPPRVHRDSLDYDVLEEQPGDEYPAAFSFMTDDLPQRQVSCWVTYTNEAAHEPIRANLHRAPMYSGQIESTGPRYCPSIEDKIVRFADKPRHQLFLEPEGYDNERIYCNGIPTSLPADVQDQFVHRIPGLEKAEILQYGYAVEYDWVPTHQTKVSLETKAVDGLFLAGQINGTSGYEEAGAQGLVAGINAVQKLGSEEPIVLRRDQAYIGVMIDDLITRPPIEPYRMFTSRAEYRLALRADNADQRLTPLGRSLGLVGDARWQRYTRQEAARLQIRELTRNRTIDGIPLRTWMRRPDADLSRLSGAMDTDGQGPFCVDDLWQVLTDAKYEGYLNRQHAQVERFQRLESMHIPEGVDYNAIPELRIEAREALHRVSPNTLGQASRIAGIHSADLTVIWVYLSGRRPLQRIS